VRYDSHSGKFKLAVIGKYDAVFAATSSSFTTYENNGVYWYFYSPKSMGFASTNMVTAWEWGGNAPMSGGGDMART
tara:strand:+ start:310 stop:537 length:228 start_codon:yes stop_codon:yes gene_type:complete